MDPNQVVPVDRLPDENDIERLFPKCPPTPGKKSFSNARKSQRKVQQHSRKELEARRNKLKLLQQQQQQQQQQLQQQPQHQLAKRQRHKQLSKSNKSTDSSDDATSDARLNTNTNNNTSTNNTVKNASNSKQARFTVPPQSFPHPSSPTNESKSQHIIKSQPTTTPTYGHSTTIQPAAPAELVNTQSSPNLSNCNKLQRNSQYSIVKASSNIVDEVRNDDSNDIINNSPPITHIQPSIKQQSSDGEIGADKLNTQQQELQQQQQQQQQQQLLSDFELQEQPLELEPSNDSSQHSIEKSTDNIISYDDNDEINNPSPSKSSASIQLNVSLSDVVDNGQDKLSEPVQPSLSHSKTLDEIGGQFSLSNRDEPVSSETTNLDNDIIDLIPSKSSDTQQTLSAVDEDQIEVLAQQMPNFNNLEISSDRGDPFTVAATNETIVTTNSSDIELVQPKSPGIQLETLSETEDSAINSSLSARIPSLRHHKLPNESSHYSIVRANNVNNDLDTNSNPPKSFSVPQKLSTLPEDDGEPDQSSLQPEISNLRQHKPPETSSQHPFVKANINIVSTDNNEVAVAPPRSSSIQFNTLSDVEESGTEGSPVSSVIRANYSNRKPLMSSIPAKKCDPSSPTLTNNHSTSSTGNNIRHRQHNLDDDLSTTAKTALIFPRLDEGLSSGAESCDDEVEYDDERAVDADVDADDDEDDIDDDADVDQLTIDRDLAALQLGQTSVDCFVRQQQSKVQYRLNGSSQQMASLNGLTDQSELHQAKAPGSATYAGYINQDVLDNDGDIKTVTNYSNHNGQPNQWMSNLPNQQQTNLQPNPSSSQQHCGQRNNSSANNNNSLSKNNNSFKRDDVKLANRLSSDTDNETDRLLGTQRNEQLKMANNDVNGNSSVDSNSVSNAMKHNENSKEVLIEGVLFNVKYLGSTHSDCEGRSEKEDRIHQAEMAVHEVKFRNGLNPESQSPTEVQLFISTEKIMVLDDKHRKIMMDHSLRTISYIADIGDAIVLIVRKKNNLNEVTNELGRPISKISCHVFESSESHTITKSISQAFQVAYTELLKANGAGDASSYLPKESDYQEVLNSQEMSTDELEMFARKENQREVIVPKKEGEIIGFGIVESGWGSVLPTVVIASLKHDGPAYRCKKLFIGDQILSINGISLVGLPLADCQQILSKIKNQRVARLSVVPCPLIVEVKIKRPDVKYQLGFSVQNGVICSLLRGGIAERGGVRVGHRIISINGTAVVDVPHEKIVTLLASSVGEIRMKTCLTSLYRLILGEENPVYY